MNISVYIEACGNIPIASWGWSAYLGFKETTDRIIFFEDIEEVPSHGAIVVACIEVSNKYLERLGISPKGEINIPECLLPFAGRKIDRLTFGEFTKKPIYPIFLKGYGKSKGVGASVLRSKEHLDLWFPGVPDDYPIMISEVVEFVSEYRVYVNNGRVLGVYNYLGDRLVFPDGKVIQETISAYNNQPAGYGIDFGVTSDGRTLLVEVNDGYALGDYGLNHQAYAALLSSRWRELLRERSK